MCRGDSEKLSRTRGFIDNHDYCTVAMLSEDRIPGGVSATAEILALRCPDTELPFFTMDG